jgi:rRNA maturation endonuclease Nob1
MLATLASTFCQFDDGHFLVIAIVGVAALLASGCRRPSRRCNRCRQVNREEAIFCAQCGRRLGQ